MRVDVPTILGITTVVVLCIIATSMELFENDILYSKDNTGKMNIDTGKQLDEINKIAINHYKNNENEKVDEQRVLMKAKLQRLASDSFVVNVTKVYLEDGYFPFLPASELTQVDQESDKPICDFASNMPTHLQKIPESEMFQLFMKKYSKVPIEFHVQDERRHGSDAHYGVYAISDDENYSAGMYVHVNSCTNEVLSNYYLSCHDKTKDHGVMIANTIERVLSSLEHEDFCTVPLDIWHQAVYDYGQVLSDQTRKHFAKAETMSKDYDTVMKFQNELERFGALNEIQNSLYQDNSIHVIQKNIQEYTLRYGQLPAELQELFDTRPVE